MKHIEIHGAVDIFLYFLTECPEKSYLTTELLFFLIYHNVDNINLEELL